MNNHLSSFQLRQKNMAHLNQRFFIEHRINSIILYLKINPSFFVDLYQGVVINEHQYMTKMGLNANMGRLWKDFIAIF